MGRSARPVQQSLLRRSYADDATFTISVRADTARRIERSPIFWYNGSLRHMAGVRGRGGGADLATVQNMVGHESVTTAGYDRREDAAKREAADLVHVSFYPR